MVHVFREKGDGRAKESMGEAGRCREIQGDSHGRVVGFWKFEGGKKCNTFEGHFARRWMSVCDTLLFSKITSTWPFVVSIVKTSYVVLKRSKHDFLYKYKIMYHLFNGEFFISYLCLLWLKWSVSIVFNMQLYRSDMYIGFIVLLRNYFIWHLINIEHLTSHKTRRS